MSSLTCVVVQVIHAADLMAVDTMDFARAALIPCTAPCYVVGLGTSFIVIVKKVLAMAAA